MTTATATRGNGLSLGLRPRRDAHRAARPERPSLDDRISALWARLVADGRAECPVCGAEMRAASPCDGCGSALG